MALTERLPEISEARPLTTGLRQLILSGEHCRYALARQLELGTSDLEAILNLSADGPLTPRELTARMGMTSGTMTALLDRVERAGFITRKDNPLDRRSLLVSTTPAGRHAAEWVNDHFDAVMTEALAEIPDLAVDQLEALLNALAQALEVRAQAESPT